MTIHAFELAKDQLLTLALREVAKNNFKDSDGKVVSVKGKVIDYKGILEIVIPTTSN